MAIVLSSAAVVLGAADAGAGLIRSCFDAGCAHWNDTQGNRIEAHSAGMLQSPTDKR